MKVSPGKIHSSSMTSLPLGYSQEKPLLFSRGKTPHSAEPMESHHAKPYLNVRVQCKWHKDHYRATAEKEILPLALWP